MAREKMVTRSIASKENSVMTVNVDTKEVLTICIKTGDIDGDKLEKVLKAEIEKQGLKFVTITETKVIEQIYGMTENDFLKYAKPMENHYTFIEE